MCRCTCSRAFVSGVGSLAVVGVGSPVDLVIWRGDTSGSKAQGRAREEGRLHIGVAAAMAHAAVHATDDRRGRDEATGVAGATSRSRLGALARGRRRRLSS